MVRKRITIGHFGHCNTQDLAAFKDSKDHFRIRIKLLLEITRMNVHLKDGNISKAFEQVKKMNVIYPDHPEVMALTNAFKAKGYAFNNLAGEP